MNNPTKFTLALVLTLLLIVAGACSVEISQTEPAAATSIPELAESPTASLAIESTNTSAAPTAASVAPTDQSTADPDSQEAEPFANGFRFPAVQGPETDIRVTAALSELDLEGQLVFLVLTTENQVVVALDLASGEIRTIFSSPPNSWVLSASLGADLDQLLLSYAPPPPEDVPQYGYSDIYVLSPDTDEPRPLLERTEDFEAFFGSVFAPDGNRVLYTHFVADDSVDFGFRYHISEVGFPGGKTALLVEDAFWQRLSPDGNLLAYVTFDPQGQADDELFVAQSNGQEARRVLDPAVFSTVDGPFFSPDNQHLYFSAVSETGESLSWIDTLTGVRLVKAHDVPSDWWRVGLDDLAVTRITEVQDKGLYGTFAATVDKIAFISARGLFIMNPDGSNIVQVLESTSLFGSLIWIP
jgi:hypothetical protein